MAQIGTIVTSEEVPAAVLNLTNTSNAFMVGFADWGPAGASGVANPMTSLSQVSALIGPPNGSLIATARTSGGATSGNSTLYDSADAFFREGGSTLYVSRVVGTTPTFGTLNLLDATGGNTATLTAAYVGAGSSSINVVVNNRGANYTVTLQDGLGNALAASPSLTATSKADLISWAAGTNLVTAASGNVNLPASVGVLGVGGTNPLTAGSDNRSTATLNTQWSNALNLGFPATLGPGQVMAPGQTPTALTGVWSLLGNHAEACNRIALLDATDGNTATQAIAEVSAAALPSSLADSCGIWAGNLKIPGVSSGTTRIIPASPVVAALCARADNLGNPNLAAAGTQFPLQYVSGLSTTYTGALTGDIATMNNSGINVFANIYQTLQNYGFVSAIAVPANDAIYWQLDHGRLRMAIVAQGQLIGQQYLFSQLDGEGQTVASFAGSLSSMLLGFWNAGALYGATSTQAFSVDVGVTVNTPASLSGGNLVGNIAVRMSPFAQLVQIQINAVPITQNLPQASATTV